MPSYREPSYNHEDYEYDPLADPYFRISFAPSTIRSNQPLVYRKSARTLSKPPVRTKPGPDPHQAVQKLERGLRKACRKASEAVVEVCNKIYKKSRSTVSTAVDKRRSIRFEDSPPPTFTRGKHRGMKISYPAPYYF